MVSALQEGLGGIRVVQSFGRERERFALYRLRSDANVEAWRRVSLVNIGFFPVISLAQAISAAAVLARESGKTIPQIALNWLLQRSTVASVIIGARNEEQLRQNLGAVGWNLSAEQVARLDAASDVTPVYPYWHQRQFGRNPKPV